MNSKTMDFASSSKAFDEGHDNEVQRCECSEGCTSEKTFEDDSSEEKKIFENDNKMDQKMEQKVAGILSKLQIAILIEKKLEK
jgi:hypothetical protein